MSLDPRRRQKKLERKKAKDKDRKLEAQRREKLAAAREKALIAVSPIYVCRVQNNLYTEGIAQAILARELPDHRLATAIYLLDSYCLGIKDSFYKILTHGEYRELLEGIENSGATRALEPAALKRLISGAVAYARQLGFEPHRDFAKAEFLLQAIDDSACRLEFEYGCEGKPFYIAGPHDSLDRQRQIIATLRRTCGDDNFDYAATFGYTRAADDDGEISNDSERRMIERILAIRPQTINDGAAVGEVYLDDFEDDDESLDELDVSMLGDDVIEAQFSDRQRE